MSHAEDWDAAAEAAAEWVTDEQALAFADAFCLIGSPEELADRLGAAADAGARSFYIRHFSSYTLPSDLLRTFAETVLPRFAGGVGSTEPPSSGGAGLAGAAAGN
jgi:5,10-methylenetetrahydromethanopterin reductase